MSFLRVISMLTIVAFTISMFPSTKLSASSPSAAVALPAFPGAEGYGANTPGGRGGTVMLVTTLSDSGPGSLRACIEASGPRICVFRVAGTITVDSNMDIENPFITIAGQTAPGGGITLKAGNNNVNSPIRIRTHDVILRYLRFRPGTTGLDNRALTIANNKQPPYNIVVDHNSFSWSGDELVIVWANTQQVTLQWNLMAESLPSTDDSAGLKGPNLGSDDGGNYSFHHNLVAHHLQRSPNISASGGPVDVVNNLIYNPGTIGARVHNNAQVNFVNNYVKAGPNTQLSSYVKDDGASGFYLADNVLAGNANLQSFLPANSQARVVAQPYAAPAVTRTSAETAYEEVLNRAGATQGLACDGTWYARRDAVDTRIVQSVRAGTRGHTLGDGYITSPADVGGWPALAAGTPCADGDSDGMPDQWEAARGLDPTRNDSAQDRNSDGYTNIEEFLNGGTPRGQQAPGQQPPLEPSLFLPALNK